MRLNEIRSKAALTLQGAPRPVPRGIVELSDAERTIEDRKSPRVGSEGWPGCCNVGPAARGKAQDARLQPRRDLDVGERHRAAGTPEHRAVDEVGQMRPQAGIVGTMGRSLGQERLEPRRMVEAAEPDAPAGLALQLRELLHRPVPYRVRQQRLVRAFVGACRLAIMMEEACPAVIAELRADSRLGDADHRGRRRAAQEHCHLVAAGAEPEIDIAYRAINDGVAWVTRDDRAVEHRTEQRAM